MLYKKYFKLSSVVDICRFNTLYKFDCFKKFSLKKMFYSLPVKKNNNSEIYHIWKLFIYNIFFGELLYQYIYIYIYIITLYFHILLNYLAFLTNYHLTEQCCNR